MAGGRRQTSSVYCRPFWRARYGRIGLVTIADFERQYRDAKPYYEYWFGEAVQKATPTSVHGLLGVLIALLLREAGYKAATEVTLEISSDFLPVPDIVATTGRFEPL